MTIRLLIISIIFREDYKGNNKFKILADNAHQFLTSAQIEQAYCEMKINASTLNPKMNQLETKRVLDLKTSLKTIEKEGESKVIIVTEKQSDTPLISDIVRLAENWDIDVYKDGSVIVEALGFKQAYRSIILTLISAG